eukprot:m.358443 g.358443  ORF g.358443 m.358443 type:complete len:182 (-) comp18146_c0_seq1:216-761(-)
MLSILVGFSDPSIINLMPLTLNMALALAVYIRGLVQEGGRIHGLMLAVTSRRERIYALNMNVEFALLVLSIVRVLSISLQGFAMFLGMVQFTFMRYTCNYDPTPRALWAQLNQAISQLTQHPRCPGVIQRMYLTASSTLSTFATRLEQVRAQRVQQQQQEQPAEQPAEQSETTSHSTTFES